MSLVALAQNMLEIGLGRGGHLHQREKMGRARLGEQLAGSAAACETPHKTRHDKTANGKLSKAQQSSATASKRFLRQWLTCEVSLQPGRAWGWGAHCLGQREALLGGRNIDHGRYVSLSLARFCCSSMAKEQICKEPPVQCNHLGQLVTGRGSLDVYLLAPFSTSQPNLPKKPRLVSSRRAKP